MKVRFYLSDDGGIVADVDGEEMELCMLDTMAEFPEDACEQMTERFQQLLKAVKSVKTGDWPSDLKMVYDRNKGSE